MRSLKKNKLGFTLIETITVIVILGILALSVSFFLMNFLKNTFLMPKQLRMDLVASTAVETMIEGDATAQGLRFSREMTTLGDNQLIFNNVDNEAVTYTLNTGTGRLYRSVDGGAQQLIPYFIENDTTLLGVGNKLFTYYDQNGNITSTAANVRRVRIAMIARTGTTTQDGQATQTSSVTVY